MRQNPKRLHRQRAQMDAKTRHARSAFDAAAPPRRGWLKAIRESLGMSAEQLGVRLGISKQSVLALEAGELRRSATLHSLARAAEALGCRFVYAIVPTQSLDAQLDERTRLVARRRLERVGHSMALESQELSPEHQERQIYELAKQLKDKLGADLWSDA